MTREHSSFSVVVRGRGELRERIPEKLLGAKQHGRMEIVREVTNVACERERLPLKLHEFLLQLLTDVILD